MPHPEAMALTVRGQLHAARGDEAATRKDLDAAIEIFEKLESRLELARALVVRARVGESGDVDLQKAKELFEACGTAGDHVNK